MARPVAYIRRSVSRRNDPGDVSRQFQTEKVRELAGADGAGLNIIDQDWGRSAAGDKTDKRLAFLELLASVERGEVSTLYAYSADRLARSVRWSAQLLDACEVAGTTIVTGEGRFAPGDDMARQMFHFQAMQNEGVLRQMTTKARSGTAARAARGDKLGRAPYGYVMARDAEGRVIHAPDPEASVQTVIDAFSEAGSFNGAARLLNERGFASPRGTQWAGNMVGRVIRRERPQAVPRGRSEARVAPRGSQRFSRLLRCPCSKMLTPRINYTIKPDGRRYGPYVSYQCYNGRHDPSHPRPYMVAEAALLEWAEAEAARFQPPRVIVGRDHEDRRAALEVRREQLGWAVADGLLSREQAKDRAAEIDKEINAMGDVEAVIEVKPIDWDRTPPANVNAVLRTFWEYVQLDEAMRPVRAAWRLPEEYLA